VLDFKNIEIQTKIFIFGENLTYGFPDFETVYSMGDETGREN
jgi:hypothetical protein